MTELSGPPPGLRYRRPLQFGAFLRQLWRSREIIRALSERELRARYKQALLGFTWAFLGPVGWVVVFSVFFDKVADVYTAGVPYVLFSYIALIPWGFFAGGVTGGATAIVSNTVLLNKVACPREVFVVASLVTAFIDSLTACLALPFMFLATGYMPKATAVWLPVVLAVQLAFVVGLALLLAAVLMYVRDVRHGLPLLTQLLLFATPVAWGMAAVPREYRRIYSLLNPMAPVIDGYRRTILFGQAPNWSLLGLGAITATVLLVVGYAAFKRLEPGFADVA